MARIIRITLTDENFNQETKTITLSERDIPFATEYEAHIKTDKEPMKVNFEFAHSTGPEFDPNTKWIYKSKNCAPGMTLEVCNDKQMTERAAANYLAAKTRRL